MENNSRHEYSSAGLQICKQLQLGLKPGNRRNSLKYTRIFALPVTGIQPDGSWYGCGWAVRSAAGRLYTWRNGSLPGMTTFMVRRFDGLNWAVLFNQRDDLSGLS
jgi:hypothetical protein